MNETNMGLGDAGYKNLKKKDFVSLHRRRTADTEKKRTREKKLSLSLNK